MKTVRGDLLALAKNGIFDVIIHGCNRRHTMGAGIARQIKAEFPAAYAADLATPQGAEKLGTISTATVQHGTYHITIVNAYTQDHWRGKGNKADYTAIRRAMRTIKTHYHGKRLAYPKIGAGLAGGDWPTIAAIIEEELAGEDHTLVEYSG